MSKDPVTDLIDQQADALGEIFNELGVMAQEYSVELLVIGAIAGLYGVIYLLTGRDPVGAGVFTFLAVALLVGAGKRMDPRFRFVRRSLDTSKVRRGWYRATKHCGFKHTLTLTRIERVSAGYRARVKVGRGIAFKDLEMRKEQLAASMAIRELRIKRDEHNASTGTLTFVRNDLLEGEAATTWPGVHDVPKRRRGPQPHFHRPDDNPPRNYWVKPKKPKEPNGSNGGGAISFWDPIPIGTGEHREPVDVTLVERNMLIGGIPGSGKSSAMSMIIARAALDPDVRVYLLDGKEVELHIWENSAEEAAYTIEEGIALLEIIKRRMAERLREIREYKDEHGNAKFIRGVTRGAGMSLYAIFIDELALFTANYDPKLAKEFTGLLTDILARGRSAGIIVCAATQKPEGSVVSTNLRDLFAYKLALRCSTPDASDTILGRGMAAQGYNAQTIPSDKPGVGYLLTGDGIPRRIRTYELQDDEIRTLAEEAAHQRRR